LSASAVGIMLSIDAIERDNELRRPVMPRTSVTCLLVGDCTASTRRLERRLRRHALVGGSPCSSSPALQHR
jgi:hypothetical protein